MVPTPPIRLRRSVIYVPGANTKAIAKARQLPVDAVIMDLEDSVTPANKAAARENVIGAVSDGGFGYREVMIRVNGIYTPWGYDDLTAVAKSSVNGVVLPKTDSHETVRAAQTVLAEHGAAGDIGLWATLETPLGILNAKEIVLGSPGLAGVILGTTDLAKEMHCAHTRDREPFITSLGLCLLAARAAGVAALDSVHLDLDDMDGFEAACIQGAAMGFDGKTVIHPKQVDIANKAFSPSPSKLEWAEKVIGAAQEMEEKETGVVVVDGKLVEYLHVVEAQRIRALAEAAKRT